MAEFVIRGAGGVLARRRKAANLTLESLAQKSGLEKSQLAKYEANKVGITDQRLAKLAVALGVPQAELAFECLLEIKPHIRSKPIGRLLGGLAKPARRSTTRPKKPTAKVA
jgi:transcriptional regulator with XRE-family HTH domain